MKKYVLIFISFFLLIGIYNNFNLSKKDKINAQIYYVDHSMLRLIPIDFDTQCITVENAAKKIIKELIEGKDSNKNVMRVIPDIENCMSVSVVDNTAIVNFNKTMIENLPKNRNHEVLMLYSIVNSLTSVKGIDNVEFLMNGKKEDVIIAGIDMRETFIPDYFV